MINFNNDKKIDSHSSSTNKTKYDFAFFCIETFKNKTHKKKEFNDVWTLHIEAFVNCQNQAYINYISEDCKKPYLGKKYLFLFFKLFTK